MKPLIDSQSTSFLLIQDETFAVNYGSVGQMLYGHNSSDKVCFGTQCIDHMRMLHVNSMTGANEIHADGVLGMTPTN
jgi:hypothetical protein